MALPIITQPTKRLTLPDSGSVIQYRQFLHGEEKLLLIAKESGDKATINDAVYDIIERCTNGTVPDIYKLSPIDFDFLFLQLRIESKGKIATIGVKCKKHVQREELEHPTAGIIPAYNGPCDTVNEVDIDLSKVEVSLPNEGDKLIKITDNVGMGMIFPTTHIVAKHGKLKTDRDVMLLIYDCIDTVYHGDDLFDVNDLDDKVKELDEFFDQFNKKQMEQVTSFFKKLPNIHMKVEYTCKSCGHKDFVTLRGIADFF